MPALTSHAKILVTGGSGFLGRHLVATLSPRFETTAFDVQNIPDITNFSKGSVTDPTAVEKAVAGMEGLVIAHMAPRRPGVYDRADLPMDINVRGTALLLDAAVRQNLKRIVLISSVSVVHKAQMAGEFLTSTTPYCPDSIYGMTKVLQEQIARFYHDTHGLEVAILRPAYICIGDSLEDKYGVRRPSVNWQFIDPRDIGQAAINALALPDLGCEVFFLMAGPGAESHADIGKTVERLEWIPQFRFSGFPIDA